MYGVLSILLIRKNGNGTKILEKSDISKEIKIKKRKQERTHTVQLFDILISRDCNPTTVIVLYVQ